MIGLGIYVPGELGVRHEDTVAVTPDGCENLVPTWSPFVALKASRIRGSGRLDATP
jgi:hypothetical protein